MSQQLPPLETMEIESKDLKKINRRSMIVTGFLGVLGFLGLRWIANSEDDNGLPSFLRQANNVNDEVWYKAFREEALVATAKPDGTPFRVNGDIGMEDQWTEGTWRFTVTDLDRKEDLRVSMEEIRKLPATTMAYDFKCIEGWSRAVECRGVKVSDFLKAYGLARTPFQFASLKTVNEGYYVSMDAKSLLHPQTLLCYEINGAPLSIEHGAPLRLMSAVKYGVKNIKQLGSMEFTNTAPPDYWAENGYQEKLMF